MSVGHDEYWSKEQYDAIESFVDAGGNLAFFSANTLWWQVRYEDDGHTMVCYKSSTLDPLTGIDNARVTVNWHELPVLRPPWRLMGVYYNGSAGITPGPYQVANPRHWAYTGVAVDSGQVFGDPMVAYEVDGFTPGGPPVLDVIAHTERLDVPDGVMRGADAVYYERTPAYGYPDGCGGKVFAGGTINWVQGLVAGHNGWTQTTGQPDPVARAITVNVLDRMSCPMCMPRLTAPSAGAYLAGPDVLLSWDPAYALRSGNEVSYTLFWRVGDAPPESTTTMFTSHMVSVPFRIPCQWWVRAAAACGSTATTPTRSFVAHDPTDAGAAAAAPLLQVQQEADRVTVMVSLPGPQDGTVRIFDSGGREVREFRLHFDGGPTGLVWDLHAANGRRVASGLYLLQLQAGSRTAQRKLVILH